MKKVLRLTGTEKLLKNESIFKESAKKIGDIDIDFINYLNLFFDVDGKFKTINTETAIDNYNYFWIGGIKGLPFKKSFIYHYIHLQKKKIIDQRVAYSLDNSKLSQIVLLKHLNLPIPKSIFFVLDKNKKKQYKEIILKRFSYPFILKNPILDRGEGVFLIRNERDLDIHLNKNDFPSYLIQEFIKNDGDYRVLATKKEILGVIKRRNKKDFRNNISIGGTSEIEKEYPKEIKNITKKILTHYKLDIAGVDFFITDKKIYVIEINDLPQYGGFEKATNISYSEKVLEYIKNL